MYSGGKKYIEEFNISPSTKEEEGFCTEEARVQKVKQL